MSEPKYDAFISYRRSDGGAVARWLRRQLEGFRVPSSLRASTGRRLSVYLDTVYERGTSDFYENNIKPALLGSRWLLVIATPAAAKRADGGDDWMHREVAEFSQGPNGGNIIALRGAGEFNDPLPADLRERFPNIEIIDLRGAGRFSFLNPIRAAKLSAEKLKVVAPLLGVAPEDMPLLRQEEERRQQVRLGTALGVTLATLIATSFLSVFALKTSFRATRALESSMFSTGRMVQSISGQLAREGDATQLRRRLLNEGCDLIDKLRSEADREAGIGELVTCRIERGLEHDLQEEQDLARTKFQEAIVLASDRHARRGGIDAALGIVEARTAMVEHLLRRKNAEEAISELQLMFADAQRLATVHGTRHEFASAEGEAAGRLGDLYRARNEFSEARNSYELAANAVDRAIAASFGKPQPSQIAWLVRLHRLAGEQSHQLKDPEGALLRYARAVDVRGRIENGQVTPGIEIEVARAYALIFEVETQRGSAEASAAARRRSLAAIGRVLGTRTTSASQAQTARQLRDWIEKQSGGTVKE